MCAERKRISYNDGIVKASRVKITSNSSQNSITGGKNWVFLDPDPVFAPSYAGSLDKISIFCYIAWFPLMKGSLNMIVN